MLEARIAPLAIRSGAVHSLRLSGRCTKNRTPAAPRGGERKIPSGNRSEPLTSCAAIAADIRRCGRLDRSRAARRRTISSNLGYGQPQFRATCREQPGSVGCGHPSTSLSRGRGRRYLEGEPHAHSGMGGRRRRRYRRRVGRVLRNLPGRARGMPSRRGGRSGAGLRDRRRWARHIWRRTRRSRADDRRLEAGQPTAASCAVRGPRPS